MIQATMEISGLYGPAGAGIRFLLSHDGDPAAVSKMLLEATRLAISPADMPRAMLGLNSDALHAGILSCHDYLETAGFHYQLWVPTEGCGLMMMVRAVRAEKGRREWFIRSGPMSLESFLLAHQELQLDDLPLWGVKTSLLEAA